MLGVPVMQVEGEVRNAGKAQLLRAIAPGERGPRRGGEEDLWQRLEAKLAERLRKEARPAPAGWITRIARGMGLRRG